MADTINHVYDGYAERLRVIAPHLKEIDYQICYLSKIGLRDVEISGLIQKTESAVQMRKNHIRNILKLQKQTNFNNELDKLVYNQNSK